MKKILEYLKRQNPFFFTQKGVLFCGDCLKIFPLIPDKSVDAVITDPPYGKTPLEWDTIIPLNEMWEQLKRIRKDRTPILLFGNEPFSSKLRMSNLKEFRYDWVWIKNRGTNSFNAKVMPILNYELISVFYKKAPTYNPQLRKGKPYQKKIKKSVVSRFYGKTGFKESYVAVNPGFRYPLRTLEFKEESGYHPSQKPLALMKYLIKTYTNEGDLVLDFACGSGTTAVACEQLNRRWIGIEINLEYCEITKKRILELKRRLF